MPGLLFLLPRQQLRDLHPILLWSQPQGLLPCRRRCHHEERRHSLLQDQHLTTITPGPTDVPTSGPATKPSRGPTPSPTLQPSLEPKAASTPHPTLLPADKPTQLLSAAPTLLQLASPQLGTEMPSLHQTTHPCHSHSSSFPWSHGKTNFPSHCRSSARPFCISNSKGIEEANPWDQHLFLARFLQQLQRDSHLLFQFKLLQPNRYHVRHIRHLLFQLHVLRLHQAPNPQGN